MQRGNYFVIEDSFPFFIINEIERVFKTCHTTLFEIFIFCPKIQLSRENCRFFLWLENSRKCCDFGLFSCWQLWFHERKCQKKFGWNLSKLNFSTRIGLLSQCVCFTHSDTVLQVSAVPNSRAALFFRPLLSWSVRSTPREAAAGTGSKIICWAPQLFFRAKRVNVYRQQCVKKCEKKRAKMQCE